MILNENRGRITDPEFSHQQKQFSIQTIELET